MMLATAGRSPARLAPKALGGFDASVEGDSGTGPFASLSRIPTGAPIRRKCAACDSDNDPEMALSPKLEVGAIDDPAEREADAVANRVMAADGGGSAIPVSGSAAAAPIRSKAAGGRASATGQGTTSVGGAPAKAIGALGSGEAMPAGDRAFFEPRLGQDLSHVRLHRGAQAEAAAAGIGARAFTIGSNIVMGEGEYGTNHTARHLLAHELAHVQQNDGVIRMACASPVDACDSKKQKDAETKVTAASSSFKTWEYRQATADCWDAAAMAEAIKVTVPSLFQGRAEIYKAEVLKFNGIEPKKIRPGDCFGFPVGWKDPNIGDVNDELKKLNGAGGKAEKIRIVSTIYGEQSHDNAKETLAANTAVTDHQTKIAAEKDTTKKAQLDKAMGGFLAAKQAAEKTAAQFDTQRQYILYAMLLRIEGSGWGPDFASVVTKEKFHSLKPDDDTHKTNFIPAKEYMYGIGKKHQTYPKAQVNTGAIDRLWKFVDGASRGSIPADAGPFYFHWWENSTAEQKYQELLKKKVPKDEAERKAALQHAKTVVKAKNTVVTEAQGWLKKIPGDKFGTANERFGSMYIYK